MRPEPPLSANAKAYLRAFDRLILTKDPEEMRRARIRMQRELAAMVGGARNIPTPDLGKPGPPRLLPDVVLPNVEAVRERAPWQDKKRARRKAA